MSYEATAGRLRIPPDTRRLIAQLQARAQRAVLLSLPSGEPRHYLYDILPNYPVRSGKGLRPVLCLAACQAYGGSYEAALPFAAAIELLHNAFLVHDDIQDGSSERRGRPALHVEYGMPLALNAGDALASVASAAAVRAARDLPAPVATAVLEGWERMTLETIEGQALDLGWQRDGVTDLTELDYLAMCGKKTAWYTTIEPLAMGAVIGSAAPWREAETFDFGWLLGLLFQLANDIDGLRAPPGMNDIDEGKRTLVLIHLLGAIEGEARAEVVRIMELPRGERSDDQVAFVLGEMERAGSVDYARDCLLELAAAAWRSADETFGPLPPGPGRDILLASTSYVFERSGLASWATWR
jgi:geranylgeranyl diphosphate synthase type II